mmetsp:Transcript_11515/g.25825  ORF Transcript_11515/g.25825 Transcript_11515/m.25825 type:complete len:164 (+) Transcript_11515:3-494(+)
MDNTWAATWQEFFSRRLADQLAQVLKNDRLPDSQFTALGKAVLAQATTILAAPVEPACLHGDFWIGNTGATSKGAVMFDPASFFGHAEFDLPLTKMFGGFTHDFHDTYFSLRPKAPGFEERERLYMLYHFLHQLNLFGDQQVRIRCVEIMTEITQDTSSRPLN